jgi:hypothetical protein
MLDRSALGAQVPDILGFLVDALYKLPVVRLVLGLASPAWRPLWALTWIVALVYVAMRIVETIQRAALRRSMVAQLQLPARGHPRPSEPTAVGAIDDTQPTGGRVTADSADDFVPGNAAGRPGPVAKLRPAALALPAALGTALIGTVLLLFSGDRSGARANSPPARLAERPSVASSDSVVTPDGQMTGEVAPDPSFAFAARGWRSFDGACVATIELTGGSQPARTLTMYVLDASGSILGKDTLRVSSLITGAFYEFRFRGVDCDAVAHWQVQG